MTAKSAETKRANMLNENNAFREWITKERAAFEKRARIEHEKGTRDDMEWIIADMCWRELWSEKPKWHNVSDEPEEDAI